MRWVPAVVTTLVLLALFLGGILGPAIGGTTPPATQVVPPKVMLTHMEMDQLATRSARFKMEINVQNPNEFPVDMIIKLAIQVKNRPGDEAWLTMGNIVTQDIQPLSWFWEVQWKENGAITLHPTRYHPFRYIGVLETVIPLNLRRGGPDVLLLYLNEKGEELGFEGPAGQVETRVSGEAVFHTPYGEVRVPVLEEIRIPYPFGI